VETPSDPRPGNGAGSGFAPLAALLAVTAFVKLTLGVVFFGFGTGDDTEVVLSAFHAAFGLPYDAWSIRSLVLPELVVAPFLELASLFGVTSTDGLRAAAAIPFVLLSTANLALLHRIAFRMTSSRAVALVAASLYAVHWIPLGYASTTFPRTASTTSILAAFLLLRSRGASLAPPAAAGALLALAATVRYGEVVFLPAAAASILLAEGAGRGKARSLLALGTGFLATALLSMGIYDGLRTGRPFSSLLAFAAYTLLEPKSSSLEPTQPLWWYLWRLPKWFPLPLVPFAFFPGRKVPGALAAMVLVPLGLLSLIHHKELRYLQGVIPFLCLLVAVGAVHLYSLGHRKATVALLAASLPWLAGGITFLGRRSMAAVEASRRIATEPDVTAVALSQAWAYGVNLYFPGVVVRDLPVEPSVEDLSAVVPGSDRVCLWADVVDGRPELAAWLEEHGLARTGTLRSGASRSVAVFARSGPPGPSAETR
jgi:hypothetical protein